MLDVISLARLPTAHIFKKSQDSVYLCCVGLKGWGMNAGLPTCPPEPTGACVSVPVALCLGGPSRQVFSWVLRISPMGAAPAAHSSISINSSPSVGHCPQAPPGIFLDQ